MREKAVHAPGDVKHYGLSSFSESMRTEVLHSPKIPFTPTKQDILL
jgi:hypothetical protein